MPTIADQYRIIATGAGWIDQAGAAGWLRLDGRDAIAFLQALVTNDVGGLREGLGAYAAYLTPQGRMIADLRIYHRGDHVLIGVAAAVAGSLATRLDLLIFSEDVRVSDVSASLAEIVVVGGAAASLLSRALTADAKTVDAAAVDALPMHGQLPLADGFVARIDGSSLPAFAVVVPAAARDAIVRALDAAGVAALSPDLFESVRVDAGRPLFGVDMDTETIPLEAGLLDRAISTSKGCYVGQEVIVRVLHRGGGRVARRLVRLSIDSTADADRVRGAAILVGDRTSGRITSVARALDGDTFIALGYVHRDDAEVGRGVKIGNDGGAAGSILEVVGATADAVAPPSA